MYIYIYTPQKCYTLYIIYIYTCTIYIYIYVYYCYVSSILQVFILRKKKKKRHLQPGMAGVVQEPEDLLKRFTGFERVEDQETVGKTMEETMEETLGDLNFEDLSIIYCTYLSQK